MRSLSSRLSGIALGSILAMGGACPATLAADLAPRQAPVMEAPIAAPSGWVFRITPYGWLTSLNGTQTVRGRSVKVDASFLDILEKSDSLLALMGNVEARNGPWAIYGDLIWSKIGAEGGSVRARPLAPGVAGTLGASLKVDIEMAVAEAGAAYEVVRSGPLGIEILGGVRYWHQDAEVSFDLTATIDTVGLDLVGTRGIARSGSVDWLDPLIGARVRYTVAPGHELFVRGDIGGFGVGSKFSWQAIAGYGMEFGVWNGIAFSGVIGYRALYVDYAKGSDRDRYEFDMLQHGPIVGLSMRF